MQHKLKIVATIAVVIVALLSIPAHAGWVQNGVPVYTGGAIIQGCATALDGNGGAYFAWWDANGNGEVRVERFNRYGERVWGSGTAVTATPFVQTQADLVSDDAGGVYVVWTDERNGKKDIYAQHIDGEGTRLWLPDGMAVHTDFGDQYNPLIVHDGFGNNIIVFEDEFSAVDIDLYAQRINSSGNITWGSPTTLTTATGNQDAARVVTDGSGGVIVVWEDDRGTSTDIYSQRVDNTGATRWTPGGKPVCTETGSQYALSLVEDGSGNAIVAWNDNRSGTQLDIYAQKLLNGGVADWMPNGVWVTFSTENDYYPTLAADMTGGAVVTWYTEVGVGDYDIYADRIDANGNNQWAENGLPVCTANHTQSTPQIVRTIEGNYIIVWDDWRTTGTSSDIYGQALDIYGNALWIYNGMPISTAVDDQSFSYLVSRGHPIVSHWTGSVIVTWLDERAGVFPHIYAQRIDRRYGEWGLPEPILAGVTDSPNDQGGYVVVKWWPSQRDVYPQTLITHYSVWRAMEPPEEEFLANSPLEFELPVVKNPGEIPEDFDGKAVWIENHAGQQQFWEWVANQDAQWQTGYSYTAATRGDSIAGNTAEHYFRVMAHTADQFKFWESNQLAGHSVDNLAPAPPQWLAATRVGNHVRLDWNPSGEDEPDFADYAIYRKTSAGVDPVPINFLSASVDTVWWDQNAPAGTPYYYVVTASDVHGNQSAPSNEAYVEGTSSGIDDTPALTSLQVMGNIPNPFTGTTELRIGLPKAANVTVKVYDVAGRLVATRTAILGKGWQDIRFNGRDDAGKLLPSGVYFYRVSATGDVVTRKMVLMR